MANLVTETTATDVCFVHLIDEDGRTLRLRGATPPFDRLVGKIELAVGEGVSGWVADHGEPAVIIGDKNSDPRYRYIPALRGEDYTSMVSVPVVTPLGHLVGVLNVHTRLRREFTTSDVDLLRSVAGLVAGAIENARLHQAGRAGGGAGAVRRADDGMAGARAPQAGRRDPRRDQPAHRQPVLPPVRGRRRDPAAPSWRPSR